MNIAVYYPKFRLPIAWLYLPALVVIGSLLSSRALWALDAPERSFIWNEAQARLAAARTPAAYLQAAQTYQKLVDSGVRNGSLFYNLGTALLQAGQIDAAIAAFERAERFGGAQADLRHNLKIALARKQNSETVQWPWFRLVLFWHFDLPAAARTMVAALAFSIFWVALTLRLIGIERSAVRAVLILAAIAMILFGSSAATSWHQETAMRGYHLSPAITAGK
ncbi:MAG: tetratricopeptide repeat protein [Lentisphaerae bacterium]|nr:tetratricopeptide repeat protein [Lentisphaerota bacterium]